MFTCFTFLVYRTVLIIKKVEFIVYTDNVMNRLMSRMLMFAVFVFVYIVRLKGEINQRLYLCFVFYSHTQ